jgi:hypothetical protein
VAAHDHVEHAHAFIFVAELILIQLAEPHAGLQHDIAGARVEIPIRGWMWCGVSCDSCC